MSVDTTLLHGARSNLILAINALEELNVETALFYLDGVLQTLDALLEGLQPPAALIEKKWYEGEGLG
jgi:hypothetical protein